MSPEVAASVLRERLDAELSGPPELHEVRALRAALADARALLQQERATRQRLEAELAELRGWLDEETA